MIYIFYPRKYPFIPGKSSFSARDARGWTGMKSKKMEVSQ